MKRFIDNQWVDCVESDLQNGDLYRIDLGSGGYSQKRYSNAVSETEKSARLLKGHF